MRALITGAGSADGIGFASAVALGHAGNRIAITSTTHRIHDRLAELRSLGFEADAFIADLTDPQDVQRLLGEVGPVDILVNNAGMAVLGHFDGAAFLEQTTDAMWATGLSRNLTSAFLMTRAALPGMRARGWGRIINIASTTGAVAGVAGDSTYAAAKAGMVGMSRSLCLEVAAEGITVNCIAPGWIATGSQSAAENIAGLATPMGRSGKPEEVASCVAYLASQGASYITGQLFIIDGGNSVMENRS